MKPFIDSDTAFISAASIYFFAELLKNLSFVYKILKSCNVNKKNMTFGLACLSTLNKITISQFSHKNGEKN